jgi:hypothetical protein
MPQREILHDFIVGDGEVDLAQRSLGEKAIELFLTGLELRRKI